MFDLGLLMKGKQAWEQFNQNHPKFSPFIDAVKARGVPEGTVIEISVKYPDDGGELKTNIRVTQSDLELLNMVSSMFQK